MPDPSSRVFRCVVSMEVFALVAEGVKLEEGEELLVARSKDGIVSRFDPEAIFRDAAFGSDAGRPDMGVVPGEAHLSPISELTTALSTSDSPEGR